MGWELALQVALLLGLLGLSLLAIESQDLLYSVILLAGASVALAVLFYTLRAPDIAITEAVVGVGVATLLYIIALSRTERLER